MGFTVYYRSLEPADANKHAAIEAACEELCRGRTWLSCESVGMFGPEEDGHLLGGSKPNFMPHPEDVASAEAEGLPDGTIQDVIDILCQISRDHDVDWEISHDESEGTIGLIQNGIPDPEVLQQIAEIGAVGDLFDQCGFGDFFSGLLDDEDDGSNFDLS